MIRGGVSKASLKIKTEDFMSPVFFVLSKKNILELFTNHSKRMFKDYSQVLLNIFSSCLDENISGNSPVHLINKAVDELDKYGTL